MAVKVNLSGDVSVVRNGIALENGVNYAVERGEGYIKVTGLEGYVGSVRHTVVAGDAPGGVAVKTKEGVLLEEGRDYALSETDGVIEIVGIGSYTGRKIIVPPGVVPPAPPGSGWEMSYLAPSTPILDITIPLENFIGWDGSQAMTNAIWDDFEGYGVTLKSQLRNGYQEHPDWDDPSLIVPWLDDWESSGSPMVGNTVFYWEFDEDIGINGSVTIYGSNSTSEPFLIKLIKTGG